MIEQNEKTKLFIEKSIKIHGDKYDYSKVEYIKSEEHIIIICKEHGDYLQQPNNHLQGKGCKKCGIKNTKLKKTSNIEEFIEKALKVHGDKYDYSKVEYIKSEENIIIICKEHGDYLQQPNNHLQGKGCKKCGIKNTKLKKTSNIEEFIEKVLKVHDDKYDYSKVEYNNCHKNVIIICKKHGEFLQTPSSHLSGHGCIKCGIEKNANNCRSNTEEFIKKSITIHGNKYDYSNVNYNGIYKDINIICKEHGKFIQVANNHLQGNGCYKCGLITIILKKTSNTIEFIEKSIKIHYDKYDYSNVEYIKSEENVIIICKKHGEFLQQPNNHLQGKGCKKCSVNNYSKSSIKYLNFMEKMYNIQIQHAENVGEHIIKTTKFSADGYCEETNTIYEFHGDFWHGNPNLYDTNDINKRNGKTFGELYQKTLEREQLIKDLGYKLFVIWEHDWNKLNKSIRTIQQKFKQHH